MPTAAPRRAIFTSKLSLDHRYKPFFSDRDGQQCTVDEKSFKGHMVTFDDGYQLFALPGELKDV